MTYSFLRKRVSEACDLCKTNFFVVQEMPDCSTKNLKIFGGGPHEPHLSLGFASGSGMRQKYG